LNFKKLLFLSIALEILIIVAALAMDGFSVLALQTITRFSGRLSLMVFSMLFLLHGRDIDALSSFKPYLIFAVVHGIHLVELLSYVTLSGTKLIPVRLVGGVLAYAFIFIMPILDNRFVHGQLSKMKFKLFENLFLYYIWLIFFLSYLPRVQGKLPNVGGNYYEFVVLLAWVSTMLGIKLTTLLRTRRKPK
jgi:hypothetical protein